MTTDVSATLREEAPHVTETTITITDAVRRQAQSIIDNAAIDPEWRALIRHYLETDDPWVAELLPRAEAGETVIERIDLPQALESYEDKPNVERIEALTEIICRAGGEPTAALFVLAGILQNSAQPEMLANAAKHYAFTRCGEFNVFGIVDAQITAIEEGLLPRSDIAG